MFKCVSRVFFANAPQLRKALLKFGKRWSVVSRARHRRQLSVVIALSQIGIFIWDLIKPVLRLIQNASRIILWRFHMDDFSSSCGKKMIILLQVSLFCPKIISESGFMDIVDDIRVIMDAVDALTSRGACILFLSEAETKADFAEVKRVKGGPSTMRKSTRNHPTNPTNNNKLIYLYNTHPSFDCTMLQCSKNNSNYCFQMFQMYPDCASLWLILSRARKARQFLEFAEMQKVRNCNFEKNKSKIFCQGFFPSSFVFSFQIISMLPFDYGDCG